MGIIFLPLMYQISIYSASASQLMSAKEVDDYQTFLYVKAFIQIVGFSAWFMQSYSLTSCAMGVCVLYEYVSVNWIICHDADLIFEAQSPSTGYAKTNQTTLKCACSWLIYSPKLYLRCKLSKNLFSLTYIDNQCKINDHPSPVVEGYAK